MNLLLLLPPLIFVLQFTLVTAVKIGVSKITTTTIAPNISTTTFATSPPTSATTEDFITTTDITTLPPTTSATIENTTTFRTFAVPTFPPKTKTTTTKTTTTTTSTTTKTTAAESTNTTVAVDSTVTKDYAAENYYCYCNLLLEACDINCCCDRDCSKETLQIFDCLIEPKQPDLRSRLEEFQYQHGLPSCKVNDGWFCVFRTNIKPKKKESTYLNLDTSNYYKWPSLLLDASEEHENANLEFYKYGEALKLLNVESKELQNFELPYGFRPPYCQIQGAIRHLKSLTRSCLLTSVEEMHEHKRKLLQLVETTKLLVKPKQQITQHEKVEENLLEIKLRKCNESKCVDIKTENATAATDDDNSFTTKIVIKILHNYTHLLDAMIELKEQNFAEDSTELWQHFEVKFIYKNMSANQDENFDYFTADLRNKPVSGPLGYLQGEPIIIGKFIANNESQEMKQTNQIINYFHANATKSLQNHTLSLFTKRLGLCFKKEAKENFINFGINTQKQCKARLSNAQLLSVINMAAFNFTTICVQLQQLAEAQLFNVGIENLHQILISQLGKPQNTSDKWLQLQVANNDFIVPIMGEFNEETHTFTCRNILLSAAYEFHMGIFTAEGISTYQAYIKHAALILGQRNDLEFSLDEVIEVPLFISVMFYDYSSNIVNKAVYYFTNINVVLLYLSLVLVFN